MDNGYLPFYFSVVILLILLVAPLATLIYMGLADPLNLLSIFTNSQFTQSLTLTFTGAMAAAALGLLLGAPVAYALARGMMPGWASRVASALLSSPITIPHTVVGLAILIMASPLSPIPLVRRLPIVNSLLGLVLAYFIVSSPIAVGSLVQVFERIDPVYEDVGLAIGMSRMRVFIKLILPMTIGEVVESYLLAWARAISEFGSIALVAYYVITPPLFNYVYPTSVLVWYYYETYGLEPALSYAAATLLVSLVVLVIMEAVRHYLNRPING